MSISTSITGGSGSNQLLDLLALVSNPDAYKAKVDALEAATAENKKYVEAIGPASEIIALREQAAAQKIEAEALVTKANADATAIVADAKAQAAELVSTAQTKATDATAKAKVAEDKAAASTAAAQALMNEAIIAQDKADKALATIASLNAAAQQAKADAEAAKKDAEATKANILAKHQAFIESL
jgi:hypothetical protein